MSFCSKQKPTLDDVTDALSETDDSYTLNKMGAIKNPIFKANVFDIEAKKIVSSVRLIKTTISGAKVTPIIWQYYRNRGNMNVNTIISKYGRHQLLITYMSG